MDSSSSWEDILFLPGGEMTATMLLARLTEREKKQSSLHSSDPFSKGTKPQIRTLLVSFTIHLAFYFEFLKILVKHCSF